MKIAFNNIVVNSTLTSLNASNNYPVANLKDTSLIKRLQSSTDTDTVTIEPDIAPVDITDVWYGYTNATQIVLRFYDYDLNLLYTHTITTIAPWIGHEYFPKVENVYLIELDYSGPADVYIGGLCLSEAEVMPDPVAEWTENPFDNSIVSESLAGQTNQNYIESLLGIPFQFPNNSREETNVIQALLKSVGIGKPLWCDFFDLNHVFMTPIYAKITGWSVTKNGVKYDIAISFKEAR